VGVVSYTNAAVDNVRDKLAELGFGYVIANLGRTERRRDFLAAQDSRNAQVEQVTARTPNPPLSERLAELYAELHSLQDIERNHARLCAEVAAHRLELRHFQRHLQGGELPDLEGLPLLRRSANDILSYLAESELARSGARRGLVRRIRDYFRYGSLRGLDPDDTAVILRLQRAYYDRRIAELDQQINDATDRLARADFDQLTQEHHQLSVDALRAALDIRYKSLSRQTFQDATYRRGAEFSAFVADYPVLSSTAHSLRNSIAADYLLDYLIIDEASQLNLLVAGLALSCCRNLVVVGDQKQLSPIELSTSDLVAPTPAYDVRRHSLLSSLDGLYGADLPRTLLLEHYRCDPMIIGFCNKKFYDGKLIPYTTGDAERPMIVVPTVEGNHMRRHRVGGRSNQREIDVIAQEVIDEHCAGIEPADVGVTAPYALQASKAADALDQIEAATVHKFQGRQKKVVIMTTVLDETWGGRTGLRFVDDPRLINVAVSRAIQRFILVTNNDMLPTSRHIRDLVGYIGYQNPDAEPVESAVVSIFDLLYSAYSERLRSLAARLKKKSKYPSENIAWTVLEEILAEDQYAHLTFSSQVLVKSLLPGRSRLTPRQKSFVDRAASVDFVVYNRVTNHPLLAIEVDGFAFHENNPVQLERDATKNEIFRDHQMPLLRLPTTGSSEYQRIRHALDGAEAHWAQLSGR
jgi:hypothetical protein